MGQYIKYSRVKKYWAAELPVNRGRFNFDTLRYDYYLDDNVAFEAFKVGAFDLREEGFAKKWATQYRGHNFDSQLDCEADHAQLRFDQHQPSWR